MNIQDTIPNLRKIVYKKHNGVFIWTASLYGEETVIGQQTSRAKDIKISAATLKELLANCK